MATKQKHDFQALVRAEATKAIESFFVGGLIFNRYYFVFSRPTGKNPIGEIKVALTIDAAKATGFEPITTEPIPQHLDRQQLYSWLNKFIPSLPILNPNCM